MAEEEGDSDKSSYLGKTPLSISGLKEVSLFGNKMESTSFGLKSFKSIDRDRYLNVAAGLDIKTSQTHSHNESLSKKTHLIDRNFGLLKKVERDETINATENHILLNGEKYNLNNNIKDKHRSIKEHSKEKKDKECHSDSSRKKNCTNIDAKVKEKSHSSKQNSNVFNMKNFIKHSPNSPVKIGKINKEKKMHKKKHKDHHKHHHHNSKHQNKERHELKRKLETPITGLAKKIKPDLTLQLAKKDLNSTFLDDETQKLSSKSPEINAISLPVKALSPDNNTKSLPHSPIKNLKTEDDNVTREEQLIKEERNQKLVSPTSKENEKTKTLKTPMSNQSKLPMRNVEDEVMKLEHCLTEDMKKTPKKSVIKELKSPTKKMKDEKIKLEHDDIETLNKIKSPEEKQEAKSKGILYTIIF